MDSARTLSENLARLLRSEHHALADFLVALADSGRPHGDGSERLDLRSRFNA